MTGRRIAFLLLLAAPLAAGGRDFWRFETAEDFLSGESRGVSIGPDGQVRLAPLVRELHAAEQPFLWRIAAADGADSAVVAGADGLLLRVRGDQVETLAESREGGIHAAATAPDGAVFYAASPSGAIHRIGADGERSILHEPAVRYIWALAVEPGGSVLAATGSPASLIRIQPSGQATTLFSSPEENFTALHRASDGTIFLGTSPSGIVFRIGADGDAMTLFDTPRNEIGAIVANDAGEVFVTALAESPDAEPGPPSFAPPPGLPPLPGGMGVPSVSTFSSFRASMRAAAQDANGIPEAGGGGNALYRIEPNGAAEAIWESAEERPLALVLLRDGRLLLGTGNRGRVHRISRDGDRTLLLRVDSEQVTAAATVGERILLGTSNPARVLALGPGHRAEGVYVSRALDAGGAARFGRIAWESRAPAGTALSVETRTGNSGEPDATWSDWRAARSGDPVASPDARFLQWRATLRSDGGASPEMVSLHAAWLAANRRPRVTAIVVHPPGAGFEPIPTPEPTRIQGMAHPLEPPEAERRVQDALGPPMMGGGRKLYRPGLRTVTFEARDPDDDRLLYAVAIRRAGEVFWNPLAEGLREPVLAWDTSGMPDGRYEIRVLADDRRDNPLDDARTGEKVSRPFPIDNTPPLISGLTLDESGRIRFEARDGASPIRRATASVAGGLPQVIRPQDGVSDSTLETYDALISGLSEERRSVVVRVEDDLGNWVTAEARVEP